MVPVPKEFSYDFWLTGPTGCTTLTCFMPNGVMIIFETSHSATLAEIKEELWDEATKYPKYGMLHDMSVYIFTYINNMAELEELVDENIRLCDIRPTGAVLIVTECVGDKADNTLNVQIGHLIGKRLQEFDTLSSAEINDFRFKMRKLGDEIAEDRSKRSWEKRLYYQFPPRLSPVAMSLADIICQSGNIVLTSKFEDNNTTFTFNIPHKTTPSKLLEIILAKKANILNTRGERPYDYVLKVCGRDEYLVGDNSIIQFQYIQECLSRDLIPTVVTMLVHNVPIPMENDHETISHLDNKKPRSSFSTLTLRKKGKHKSSWNIQEDLTITLCTISGLNCDTKRPVEVGLQVGLFHGGKSLCQPQKTTEKLVNDKCECTVEETLKFDIKVHNIPRCAKLCFVVCEVAKSSKGSKTKKIKESSNNKDLYYNPIAWANTTVFDFKSQLKTGAMTLFLWTYADDMLTDDFFHPLGTVVSNPNTKYATTLTLTFDSYGQDQTIIFPTLESVINFATEKLRKEEETPTGDVLKEEEIQKLEMLIHENDSLYEMHDQDRKKVWSLKRYWLQQVPDILPKILQLIEWEDHKVVSDVVCLLQEWPLLAVEKALELLDYAYADQEVRSFAVKCLGNVSDEDLLLYLLQLIQALKHELYLDCDLVKFLLQRALNNQTIGHYLFWHLRSEMQVASVSVRFGLILEAYCRGSKDHICGLLKQLECLEKLKKSSELVRLKRDKDKAKTSFLEYLTEHVIEDVRSPLDPSFKCQRIKKDKCKVMDSKMRPLWIVFENKDTYGDDIYIIFKNGDDLRQDMLTLQLLRIMDKLWKQEDLDLRINPYNCISMEYRVGMIEVVLNAETIANIQKEKGMFSATSAFRKGSLLAWLRDYNTTESALKKAITEFTLSCAGYCVATYVLGIADRHSDNIMVKKTGQLFHIDFGHILGHFKEKFGFKRERVPFVLTHDFVHVISKGQKNAIEFKVFQEYCEKAFMILRKHGGLILSLCAMMISTGLPELSSEKDLNYLRETLALSKTDDEALIHFRSKFDEALSNSWKTSVNWATHNLAKNNKA